MEQESGSLDVEPDRILSPAAAARWERWRAPMLAGLCSGGGVAAGTLAGSGLVGAVGAILFLSALVWLGRRLQREGAISDHPGAVMIASLGLLASFVLLAWLGVFVVQGIHWRGDPDDVAPILLVQCTLAWVCWWLGRGAWPRGARAALIASAFMGLAFAVAFLFAPMFGIVGPAGTARGAGPGTDLPAAVVPTLAWLTVGIPAGGLLWLAGSARIIHEVRLRSRKLAPRGVIGQNLILGWEEPSLRSEPALLLARVELARPRGGPRESSGLAFFQWAYPLRPSPS